MKKEKVLGLKAGDTIRLKSTINTFIDNKYDDEFLGKDFTVEELGEDVDGDLIVWLKGTSVAFNWQDIKCNR